MPPSSCSFADCIMQGGFFPSLGFLIESERRGGFESPLTRAGCAIKSSYNLIAASMHSALRQGKSSDSPLTPLQAWPHSNIFSENSKGFSGSASASGYYTGGSTIFRFIATSVKFLISNKMFLLCCFCRCVIGPVQCSTCSQQR